MGRVRPLPVEQPGEEALQGGIVGGQHDQDQHNGVHQHAVVGELPQGLGQDGQSSGSDHRAPHVAQTAQNHEHQDQDGGVEVKLGGGEGNLAASIQGTGGTGQSSRGNKGNHLVLGHADTHALGSDAVVPGGHDGPAGAAVDQIENNDQGDHHQDKTGNKGGDPGGVHHAHGTFDQLDAALAQGVLIAEEAELEAVLIHAQINVGQQALDDLAESQGNNGQIVAVEAQHGDTDKEAEETGQGGAHQHGHGQAQGSKGDHAGQSTGSGAAHKGADAHKSGVAQAQLAGHANHQVQGQSHGDVGTDGDQLSLQHRADANGTPQHLDDQEGHNDQSIGKQAGPGGLVHIRKSNHSYHLTLSRARSCPANQRA